MLMIRGNIFDFALPGNAIVVPANIGWTKRGLNVMGAGVAKQAALRWPELPRFFGVYCRAFQDQARVNCFFCGGIIVVFFPVKPLNKAAPYRSWQSRADLVLVAESVQELGTMSPATSTYLPLVGCGNGGLNRDAVLPILEKHLTSDRFVLVEL